MVRGCKRKDDKVFLRYRTVGFWYKYGVDIDTHTVRSGSRGHLFPRARRRHPLMVSAAACAKGQPGRWRGRWGRVLRSFRQRRRGRGAVRDGALRPGGRLAHREGEEGRGREAGDGAQKVSCTLGQDERPAHGDFHALLERIVPNLQRHLQIVVHIFFRTVCVLAMASGLT